MEVINVVTSVPTRGSNNNVAAISFYLKIKFVTTDSPGKGNNSTVLNQKHLTLHKAKTRRGEKRIHVTTLHGFVILFR